MRDYKRSGSMTMQIVPTANEVWRLLRPSTVIHLLPHRLKGEKPKTNWAMTAASKRERF